MDVVEGPGPQPEQRPLRRPGQPGQREPVGDGGDGHDDERQPSEGGDRVGLHAVAGHAAVDRLLDDDRHHHPAAGADEGEHEGDRNPFAELGAGPPSPLEDGHGLPRFDPGLAGELGVAHVVRSPPAGGPTGAGTRALRSARSSS